MRSVIMKSLKTLIILSVFAPFAALFATSSYSGPGWCEQSTNLHCSVTDALMALNAPQPLSSTPGPNPPESTSMELRIRELSAALDNDPVRIYEYVLNTIEYVPYYGQLKGAERALLDEAANDADQSALLIRLLDEAGYDADYAVGVMTLPLLSADGYDLSSWLGVSWIYAGALLDCGGTPFDDNGNYTYDVTRVWVRVQIDGSFYDLDPAFKCSRTHSSGDIRSIAGYDRNDLLSVTGGSYSDHYAHNFDMTAVSSHISSLTTNLASELKSSYPNAALEDVAGGRSIRREEISALPGQLRFSVSSVAVYGTLPAAMLHPYSVSYGDITVQGYFDEIATDGLTLCFSETDATVGGTAVTPMTVQALSSLPFPPVEAGEATPVDLSLLSVPESSNLVTTVLTTPGGDVVLDRDFGYVWDISPYNKVDWIICQLYDTYDEDLAFSSNPSGCYSIIPDTNGGDPYDVEVRFNGLGKSRGTKTALLEFESGWQGPGSYDIQFALTGVVKEFPQLSAGSYGCSVTKYLSENTKTGTARLKNSGSVALTLTSIMTVTGSDASRFSIISGGQSGSIPAGGYRDITVSYNSASIGVHDDAVIHINFLYEGQSFSWDYLPVQGQTVSDLYAQLWCGDTLMGQQLAPMTEENMSISITHPTYTTASASVDYPVKLGGTYAVITGFGSSGNGKLLKKRQATARQLHEQGLQSLSPEILSESLHVIGQTWLQETSLQRELLDNLLGIRHVCFHRLGVAAQEESYYVDVKAQFSNSITTGARDSYAASKTASLFASAMEHGALEQLQSSDREAISTVKILKIANDNDVSILRVTDSNFNLLESTLRNFGYSDEELDEIEYSVNNNDGMFILPKVRDTTLGDWSGKGYIQCESSGGVNSIGMIIEGEHNGGYAAYQWYLDTTFQDAMADVNYYDNAENFHPTEADPVDMITGAYTFNHSDISLSGPLPLNLTRSYNSAQHNVKGTMGYGWTHSLNIHARRHSVYEDSLGLRTPEDAASLMVASTVVQDLIENEDTPRGWLTAALVTQWAMDQLTENAVSIFNGTKTLTFIEQPDGSFTSPPGVTSSLSMENGVYVLRERHGSVYTFNSELALAQMADPDGNTLTFSYDTLTNLQSVVSSFGPSLTFGYTGGLLSSVTDNSTPARSISYQYNADDDLTSFTDADGHLWSAAYDDEHRVISMQDPENITTIQNFYDSTGQVTNQISSSGNPWNFWFTGSENISEDPLGNRTVYHIDEQQRTWSVEQPNGARGYTFYDGQNHTTASITPNNVTNLYLYDPDHNLLARVDAFDAPEELITTYGYDAQHHLIAITNAAGTLDQSVTHITYTTEHHVDIVTEAVGTSEQVVTDTDYYADGLPLRLTEGNGLRVTDYTYNANGNPLTLTSTDAGTTHFIYNLRGELTQRTDAEGNTTAYTYNNCGLPLDTTLPDTSVSGRTYWDNRLLKTSTDPEGNTTHHHWNAAYKQTLTIFADGSSISNVYDSADRLIATRDAEDNWAFHSLNEIGQVLTTTTELSVVSNTFDIVGNRIAFTDAEGRQTQFSYDALNRKVREDMADGSVNTFGYDTLGRLIATTNQPGTALERVGSQNYDSLGRVVLSTDVLGNQTDYGYNALGFRTLTRDPLGNETRTDYNALGKPVSVTNALDQVTLMTYDYNGNLESVTDPLNRVTQYAYNNMNQLVRTDLPDGSFVTAGFDSNGNVLTKTDARGTVTTFAYNDMNRLTTSTRIVDSVPAVTGYTYNNNGSLLTKTDPEGNLTTFLYDALGRQVSVASASSLVTNEFDAVGNLTYMRTDPNNLNLWTMNGYDPMNRLASQQTSLASKSFLHDKLGRVTNSVNALSKTWKTEYDLRDQPTAAIRPTGAREETQFDALGRRTRFMNAEGKAVSFGFDALGRLISATNAIGKVTHYGFDPAGNLAWRVNAADELTEYDYDAMNRLISVTHESVEVSTYDHDSNGNIILSENTNASIAFDYNEQNLLTSTTQSVLSVSSVVENSYNLNGNRTNIIYPGGLSVSYHYGADNRLLGASISAPSAPLREFSFGYDTANRLTGIAYPNGVNSAFGYDAESRVTNIVHGSFIDRKIQRNALGFKTLELINAGIKPEPLNMQRRIATHNDTDQLVGERIQSNVTNWTDVAYTYNDNGGLEEIDNGELIIEHEYDYDNRLVLTTEGTESTEYIYDASGVRIGRTHNGTNTYYIVDYADALKRPLAEFSIQNSSPVISRFYVWSGSRLLCHIEAVAGVPDLGTVRYYHADELGSTLALTDETGTVTDQFAYMPYGYATHTAGPNSSFSTQHSAFLWLGGYGVCYDIDTQLHLTLHRAYSCDLKRFITPDPLGIDGGVNVYMMANINPLFFIDPYGLSGLESSFLDYASEFGSGAVNCVKDMAVGIGDLVWNTGGSLGYGAVGLFNYELAEEIYGDQAQGMRDFAYGVGDLVWDTGGTIAYGYTSMYSPDLADDIYGGQREGFINTAQNMTGGDDASGAYRAGYVATGLLTAYAGNKVAQVANKPITLTSGLTSSIDDVASGASRHTLWANNIDDINATVERLGQRALRESGGNWQVSEQIFEGYLQGVENRLIRTGSQYNVKIQPAALPGGEIVPPYVQYGGANGPIFPYPGSRRLDAGIFNSQTGSFASGFDITLNSSKPSIVPYYQEAFGNIPIFDIRTP